VKRIADFAIKNILFPLAVLLVVIGGIMLLTASGNPEKVAKGKTVLTTTVIGIFIILVAWLFLNAFIYFLTRGSSGGVATILGKPWNEIRCPICGDKICEEPPENYQNCPVDCSGFLWVPNSGVDPSGHPVAGGNTISQIALRTMTIDGTTYATGSVIKTYNVGNNPSRVTVMLGGDVFVANRFDGTVTRLSPSQFPYYDNINSFFVGGQPRAVTYDAQGNIWVGSCFADGDDSSVKSYTRSGSPIASVFIGAGNCSYGAIGDPFGYVWIANRDGNSVIRIDIRTNTVAGTTPLIGDVYGIGIDNEGDIWVVASAQYGMFCQINGAKSGAIGTLNGCWNTPIGNADIADGDTNGDGNPEETWGDARGIAVDGNNNVWVAASSNNTVYSFTQNGTLRCSKNLGSGGVVGIAPDPYGYIWAVVYDNPGRVYRLDQGCNIKGITTVGPWPYNYSDMTGFRTVGCFIFE
jgi:streptogramin lyase